MAERTRLRARAGYRRARKLRRERRGVVAVVGTLLSLLVFFALFGIFLTQYLPLWMTENEIQFTDEASASLTLLKSSIDAQYAFGGPQSFGTAFTISSNSVPLLAQPTQGTLEFLPQTCPGGFYAKGISGVNSTNFGQPVVPGYCVFYRIAQSPGPGGSTYFNQSVPSGEIQFVLPNRYYTPETFYFEDDAIIQSQGAAYQLMTVPPPLNVTYASGNTSVTSSFLQLFGNTSTVFGQGTQDVYSTLQSHAAVSSNGGSKSTPVITYTFEIGTQNPCAWSTFLTSVISSAEATGLPSSHVVLHPYKLSGYSSLPYTGSCVSANGATTVLAFQITSVSYTTLYLGSVQITMGVGAS